MKEVDKHSLQNDLSALTTFLNNFAQKHSISFNEVIDLLKQKDSGKPKEIIIPSSILRSKKLGILQAVAKYLKEDHNLGYNQIARLLKRDDRVVWVTYNQAAKKMPEPFEISEPTTFFPVSIFTKDIGPMQAIATHLKDEHDLTFSQIADLLDRDTRTIWACYNKAKKKESEE